jgi:hypothetical protein
MQPAAQQVAGGPHRGRIDVGLGEHPAPQQDGDLVGVDPVVLGFAAVDGFHIEGVPEDEADPFGGAEIGEPVPGEHALDGNDEVFAVRGDRVEERLRGRPEVAVQQDLARLVEDAQIHRAGVEIDAAVVLVLLGVKAHDGLLLG